MLAPLLDDSDIDLDRLLDTLKKTILVGLMRHVRFTRAEDQGRRSAAGDVPEYRRGTRHGAITPGAVRGLGRAGRAGQPGSGGGA